MSELKKCPFAEIAGKRIVKSLRRNAFFTSAWEQIDKGVGKAFFEDLFADIIDIVWRENRRSQPDGEAHGLTAWETPESCPNCNEHLSKEWSYCPECGRVTDWADNEPLTPEELRGMDLREWCWIEVLVPFDFAPKVSAYYQRQEVGTESGAMRGTFWCGYPGLTFGFDYSDYGKTWLAYRRKPEPEGGNDA